jgi:hypothetical protein
MSFAVNARNPEIYIIAANYLYCLIKIFSYTVNPYILRPGYIKTLFSKKNYFF